MEEFEKFIKDSRDQFCKDIDAQEWNTDLRCTAENLLVAYDQLFEKYKETQKNELGSVEDVFCNEKYKALIGLPENENL